MNPSSMETAGQVGHFVDLSARSELCHAEGVAQERKYFARRSWMDYPGFNHVMQPGFKPVMQPAENVAGGVAHATFRCWP